MDTKKLLEKFEEWKNKLSDKNPLKKALVFVQEKFPERMEGFYNDFFDRKENVQKHFSKPILSGMQMAQKEQKDKKSDQIKKNAKKIMLNTTNMGVVFTVWGMKLAGKTTKWTGRAVKLSGRTIQGAAAVGYISSLGIQGVGKTLNGLGRLTQIGGEGLSAALMGTKIGAFFLPVSKAITGLGIGISGTGKGIDSAGKAGRTFSKQLNRYGKNVVKVGDKITKTGKQIEKNAKRLNKIRKYYLNKEKQKLSQPTRTSKSLSNNNTKTRVSLYNRLSEASYQGGLTIQTQKRKNQPHLLNLFHKNNKFER